MDTPEDNWRRFRSLWLRVAVNIAQNGHPLLLFGSADPEQYEHLPERRYVSSIHTLALVCDEAVLRRRLTARPKCRGSGNEGFITSMCQFNRSLHALAARQPERVSLLDTTRETPDVSAAHVVTWARTLLERKVAAPRGVGGMDEVDAAREEENDRT